MGQILCWKVFEWANVFVGLRWGGIENDISTFFTFSLLTFAFVAVEMTHGVGVFFDEFIFVFPDIFENEKLFFTGEAGLFEEGPKLESFLIDIVG